MKNLGVNTFYDRWMEIYDVDYSDYTYYLLRSLISTNIESRIRRIFLPVSIEMYTQIWEELDLNS